MGVCVHVILMGVYVHVHVILKGVCVRTCNTNGECLHVILMGMCTVALVAQLVEHLSGVQSVVGLNPT